LVFWPQTNLCLPEDFFAKTPEVYKALLVRSAVLKPRDVTGTSERLCSKKRFNTVDLFTHTEKQEKRCNRQQLAFSPNVCVIFNFSQNCL
jgi:hypothetical protein